MLTAWDAEYGSQPSKRPSIQTILNQLKEDVSNWDRYDIPLVPKRGEESRASTTLSKNAARSTHTFPSQQHYWATPNGEGVMVNACLDETGFLITDRPKSRDQRHGDSRGSTSTGSTSTGPQSPWGCCQTQAIFCICREDPEDYHVFQGG